MRLDIFLLQLILERLWKLCLSMSLQHVHLRQLVADHIVDGGSDGAFSVKRGIVGIGIWIGILQINIIIADKTVLIPALYYQAVILNCFISILLGESRIDIRVFLDHLDMVRQTRIFT